MVDNLTVRHAIPWSALEAIEASGGIRFRLRDGTSVASLMYGGSFAGALSGYPYLRRVAARMSTTQAELSPGEPGTLPGHAGARDSWYVSPWPPLLIVSALELVAVLALLTR